MVLRTDPEHHVHWTSKLGAETHSYPSPFAALRFLKRRRESRFCGTTCFHRDVSPQGQRQLMGISQADSNKGKMVILILLYFVCNLYSFLSRGFMIFIKPRLFNVYSRRFFFASISTASRITFICVLKLVHIIPQLTDASSYINHFPPSSL